MDGGKAGGRRGSNAILLEGALGYIIKDN